MFVNFDLDKDLDDCGGDDHEVDYDQDVLNDFMIIIMMKIMVII